MARKRIVSNLHQLTVREVLAAGDGDHTDGGGLLLRVRGESASWVLRYTAATGKRREMGLGVARRGSNAQAGDALTLARRLAHEARELLQAGRDPIDERDQRRGTARALEAKQKAIKARERLTLARAARDYHERVIEPSRTVKHAAQWIASLEHHVPAELWHAPIDSIEAPALLAALTGVRALADMDVQIPETLKRVRQRLDAVFEDAIFHGLCKANPAAAVRRKMQEGQGRRERGQYTALPYRDAPAFMARLREQKGVGARCLELAMLTAARTRAAAGRPRRGDARELGRRRRAPPRACTVRSHLREQSSCGSSPGSRAPRVQHGDDAAGGDRRARGAALVDDEAQGQRPSAVAKRRDDA